MILDMGVEHVVTIEDRERESEKRDTYYELDVTENGAQRENGDTEDRRRIEHRCTE
jgi:hypothetical protein